MSDSDLPFVRSRRAPARPKSNPAAEEVARLRVQLAAMKVERDFWVEQARALQNHLQTVMHGQAAILEQMAHCAVTAQTTIKPPAQCVGVSGIASEPALDYTRAPVNWAKLARLPPFQMYAAEQMHCAGADDSLAHAQAFIAARGVTTPLLAAYCAWHAAKGCWPGETPLGEAAA
ncbi:MAG: hypothetical protein LBH10_02240 [Burkholderiaceae bacterium]|jgi:hypothetical protein|nr:hypothetical protein [Burkholderiaceae bacterium]